MIPVAGETGIDRAGNLNQGAGSRYMYQSGDRHPVVQEFQPSAIKSKPTNYGAPVSTNSRVGSNTGTTLSYSQPVVDGRSTSTIQTAHLFRSHERSCRDKMFEHLLLQQVRNYQTGSLTGANANSNVSVNYPGTYQSGATTRTGSYGQTNVQPRPQNPESTYKTYTPVSTNH